MVVVVVGQNEYNDELLILLVVVVVDKMVGTLEDIVQIQILVLVDTSEAISPFSSFYDIPIHIHVFSLVNLYYILGRL